MSLTWLVLRHVPKRVVRNDIYLGSNMPVAKFVKTARTEKSTSNLDTISDTPKPQPHHTPTKTTSLPPIRPIYKGG